METNYIGKNLKDVGTRYEHYRELLGLWEDVQQLIEERPREYPLSNRANKVAKRVRIAIDLLRKHLDNMSSYEDKTLALWRTVNNIPRDPEEIVGGRGTPLRGVDG